MTATVRQTTSFRDWGAWMVDKTGSGQVWNRRYRADWNRYLSLFGLEVMIGLLMDRTFERCEYAVAALRALEAHPKSAYIQTVCRERYLATKKAEDTAALSAVIEDAVDFNSLAGELAGKWVKP